MAEAKLTSKGQITVPKAVRVALGVEPGDRIAFRVRDDGVVEMHPRTLDLLSLAGAVQPGRRGVDLEAMQRAIESGAAGE